MDGHRCGTQQHTAHTRHGVAAEIHQMSAQQLCFLTMVRDHKMTSHST